MKKKIISFLLMFTLLFVGIIPVFTASADSKKPNIVYWQDFNAKQTSTAVSSHSVPDGNITTNEVEFVDAHSNYGSAVKWSKTQAALSDLNIYAPKNPQATDIEALAFWVEISDAAMENNTFCFFLYDDCKSGKRECWYIKQEPQIVYAMDESTMKPEALATQNRNIQLPAGFCGWVLIPTASLGLHSGYATDNGVLDYSEIANIHIRIHNNSQFGNFYFDEFLFTRNINDFLETMGADMTEIYNYYVINDFESDNETSVLNLTEKSTKLKLDDYYSAEYNSLHIKSSGDTKLRIYNRLEDSSVLTGSTLSFWIKNVGDELSIKLSLICKENKFSFNSNNLKTDYYLLSNMSDGKSTAYIIDDGKVHIPKDFEGYVTLTSGAITPKGFDAAKLEYITLTCGEGEYYIDNISVAENLFLYITDDLNCYIEENLIFATDTRVTVNDSQIIYNQNMSSQELFEALAVRNGYRAVLLDENGEYIYGFASNISGIKGVHVFSGGTLMAEYELLYKAAPKTNNSFIYIIVISAIIVSIGLSMLLAVSKKRGNK